MTQKEIGITQPVWDKRPEQEKIIWRILVWIFAFVANILVTPIEVAPWGIIVAVTMTIYLIVILNAERGYSKISPEKRKFIHLISWTVPLFIITITSILAILLVLGYIAMITHEHMAAPMLEMYPKELIIGLTIFSAALAFKMEVWDSKGLQETFKGIRLLLQELFKQEGINSRLLFVAFELGAIGIGAALVNYCHVVINAYISLI